MALDESRGAGTSFWPSSRFPGCSVASSSNACKPPSTQRTLASSAILRAWLILRHSPPIQPPRARRLGCLRQEAVRRARASPRHLGRYTHRVAIANRRIKACDDNHVAFTWKDYGHEGAVKMMRLTPDEVIRRVLLHALPDGFHRIRHFGFLANSQRAERLALCRSLLTNKPEPSAH